MTMPATRAGRCCGIHVAPGRERPMPSSARAGASLPSVRTSESRTTSIAGVGSSCTVSLSVRSMARLVSRCADIHRSPVLLPAWRVCGSQEAHSHSSARPASQKTPTVRSAGPTCTAAWARRDRASARAPSRGPPCPPLRHRSGPPGRVRPAGVRPRGSPSPFRPAANLQIGQGPASHGTSPVPACRARKSSASARRCHRDVAGRAGRRTTVAGSGIIR